MKTFILIFIILTNVRNYSLAQSEEAKYYCQGCCGGIGVYYLKLHSINEFELYYLVENRSSDNSAFGIGTYDVKENILILSFKDILHASVESKKVNDSDSLIIYFYAKDNVRGDSVSLVNVKMKDGRSFFYLSTPGTIRSKFSGAETVQFSSLSFNDITYTFTEPGEYELVVKLNPEGKTMLKKGYEKTGVTPQEYRSSMN